MKLSLVTVALVASLAVACGSSPPPTARYASATSSVRAAKEVGAENTPDAQLHLKMAEDELGTARRLMNDGHNDKAAWVLARSQSDAELSLALAREADARAAADQANAQLRQTTERPQQEPRRTP